MHGNAKTTKYLEAANEALKGMPNIPSTRITLVQMNPKDKTDNLFEIRHCLSHGGECVFDLDTTYMMVNDLYTAAITALDIPTLRGKPVYIFVEVIYDEADTYLAVPFTIPAGAVIDDIHQLLIG